MRKKVVLLGLLSVFLSQNLAQSENICSIKQYGSYPVMNTFNEVNNELSSLELDTVKVDKSKKFIVQSLQPMSSSSPIGTVVNFKSVRSETLIPGAQPTEVIFTGQIIENNPPRLVGRSSTLKLKIDTMKVGNITYHTVAYISRMGKKMVMTGVLTGNPIYMENLADTANRGTITIDKVYKDPCKFHCESIKSPIRPLYYLGGAVLQVADLLLSPVICVFKRGGEIEIHQYTSFEIKLEDSVSLLKL